MHLEPSNITSAPYKAVVCIARQLRLQPQTKPRVTAAEPVSELSLIKPALLNHQFFDLHVAPEEVGISKGSTFGVLNSNLKSMIKLQPKNGSRVCRRTAHIDRQLS